MAKQGQEKTESRGKMQCNGLARKVNPPKSFCLLFSALDKCSRPILILLWAAAGKLHSPLSCYPHHISYGTGGDTHGDRAHSTTQGLVLSLCWWANLQKHQDALASSHLCAAAAP